MTDDALENLPAEREPELQKPPKPEKMRPEQEPDIQLSELVSEWQYSRIRLRKLVKDPNLRFEMILVVVFLFLVFGGPAALWIRRWTMAGSVQQYALFVVPTCLVWCWFSRLRLATPEVDPIRKALRFARRTRMAPLSLGQREPTVLNVLVEDPPVLDRRSSALLVLAILFDIVAFWFRDPTLTCFGFVATVAGFIWFRHGRFALRALLFPILLMLTMVPLPSPLTDVIVDKAQPAVLNIVQHIVNNGGAASEIPPEGNPLSVNASGHQYVFYAQRAGTGISESLIILMLAFAYLSLLRTPNILPRIGVFISLSGLCMIIIIIRIVLLCLISIYDKDIASFLESVTRYLLPAAGISLFYLLLKGFKCEKYQRWVALSSRL